MRIQHTFTPHRFMNFNHHRSRSSIQTIGVLFTSALMSLNCSSVSKDWAAQLENRVEELEIQETPSALMEKVAASEAATAETLRRFEEDIDGLKKSALAIVQPPKKGEKKSGTPWGATLEQFFGLGTPPVAGKKGNYTVSKSWVRERVMMEARAMPVVWTESAKGVMLKKIPPSSSLGRLGLKSKDIISAVNGTPVKTTAELMQTLGATKAKEVLLTVTRRKKKKNFTYALVP